MVQCVSSRTHPKNSTNVLEKAWEIFKGRAQKGSINRQENIGGRVQKTEKYMIFDVLVPEMEKLVIFVFTVEHTDAPHNVS